MLITFENAGVLFRDSPKPVHVTPAETPTRMAEEHGRDLRTDGTAEDAGPEPCHVVRTVVNYRAAIVVFRARYIDGCALMCCVLICRGAAHNDGIAH